MGLPKIEEVAARASPYVRYWFDFKEPNIPLNFEHDGPMVVVNDYLRNWRRVYEGVVASAAERTIDPADQRLVARETSVFWRGLKDTFAVFGQIPQPGDCTFAAWLSGQPGPPVTRTVLPHLFPTKHVGFINGDHGLTGAALRFRDHARRAVGFSRLTGIGPDRLYFHPLFRAVSFRYPFLAGAAFMTATLGSLAATMWYCQSLPDIVSNASVGRNERKWWSSACLAAGMVGMFGIPMGGMVACFAKGMELTLLRFSFGTVAFMGALALAVTGAALHPSLANQ